MNAGTPIRPWTLLDCSADAPQHIDAGGRHWIVRTANFLVIMTVVDGQTTLSRSNHPDEYMVLIPSNLQAVAVSSGVEITCDGDGLFIVPPGTSEFRVSGKGVLVRVFSTLAQDLAALAVNRLDYVRPPAEVVPLVPWPAPIGGFRLRHYALAEHLDPSHISRIFRSTNLMLNVMKVYPAPRDPHALMPHMHPNEEQISVAACGRFVHHLRTPWRSDSTLWCEDEHIDVGSPSALVIPSGLIHTTQAMEPGCWLIDVFGPPRVDFSSKPGLVRNAAEYPMPQTRQVSV